MPHDNRTRGSRDIQRSDTAACTASRRCADDRHSSQRTHARDLRHARREQVCEGASSIGRQRSQRWCNLRRPDRSRCARARSGTIHQRQTSRAHLPRTWRAVPVAGLKGQTTCGCGDRHAPSAGSSSAASRAYCSESSPRISHTQWLRRTDASRPSSRASRAPPRSARQERPGPRWRSSLDGISRAAAVRNEPR
jgi:hypothetical protein